MKRLSFFRLTRVLPASIALSGIAALVGCMSPSTGSYDNGYASASRRGGLISDSGGNAVMVAGGPGATGGTVVTADGRGVSGGGVVVAGGPGTVTNYGGGYYVDGGYSDGGCASGTCGRGGYFRGGLTGSIDRCAQVPPGSLPAQLGSSVRAFHKVQKENADLDKYVVYLHEWYQNGTEVGPWGRNHLVLIAKRLPAVTVPVIVQASPDAQLNEIRRQRIVDILQKIGVPGDVDSRVVVGFPEALDLDGNIAPIIYYQSLIPGQYQNNGYGGSGYGNFGGGGFGGLGGFGAGFGAGGFGGGFGGGGRPFGF
jgi:hypothetical protein